MEIGKISGVNETIGVTPISPLTPQEREHQWELIRAVESVNSAHLFGESTELTFRVDRQTQRTVLQIVDRQTGEVVRQLPPEYLLRLAQELQTK